MSNEQGAFSGKQKNFSGRQKAISGQQIVHLQRPNNPWPMIRAMVGIGLVCAIIIVVVFRMTASPIQHNRQQLLEQSIFQLFPQAKSFLPFELDEQDNPKHLTGNPEAAQFYAVYDPQNRLLGFAIKVSAMGYQDEIHLLYAYQPQLNIINGYKILQSHETPGLGGRIETDPAFLGNFHGLPVPLNHGNTALLHPLEVVKPGTKSQAWQIDTISGATISSRALARAVANSAAFWLPKLKKHLELYNHARFQ
jgi:electron transport complex protein RnfG